MLIEILGSGCPKCYETERRARQAVKQAGIEAELKHVTDLRALAARGVLATPAVVLDGRIALSGSLPSVRELVALFINHLAAAEPAAGPVDPSMTVDG
jgi:small redox-active disulfide protein 2